MRPLTLTVGVCLLLVACLESTKREDAGTSDAGGSGGTGGTAGSGGTGGTAGSGGTGGTAGSGGTGGDDCAPACGVGRVCCEGTCVNVNNDPRNCGTCGTTCAGTTVCSQGTCVQPPCATTCTEGACCGNTCCGAGQICCDIEGPVGGITSCVEPIDGTCPQGCAPLCICNSPDTPIATLDGDRPVASLQVGDLVYSVDHGALVLVPIARVHRVPVVNHHVTHLVLSSGATLDISPNHPLIDGTRIGDLRAGDTLDHATVISAELTAYTHDFTYDILPASDTGFYVAGGVLIASTLR